MSGARTRGAVCLQGGAELQPGCEGMDSAVLAAAPGPHVVVVPYAGAPGREREVAGGNAVRWYEGLGAAHIRVAFDEVADADLLASADLLVLLGGSPARLLSALEPHRELLAGLLADGVAVSGASAGAMVLCRWSVLPGRTMRVVPALDLAPADLVLPHYSASSKGSTAWLDAARGTVPAGSRVLGLPEHSGVLVDAHGEHRVGVGPAVELAMPG